MIKTAIGVSLAAAATATMSPTMGSGGIIGGAGIPSGAAILSVTPITAGGAATFGGALGGGAATYGGEFYPPNYNGGVVYPPNYNGGGLPPNYNYPPNYNSGGLPPNYNGGSYPPPNYNGGVIDVPLPVPVPVPSPFIVTQPNPIPVPVPVPSGFYPPNAFPPPNGAIYPPNYNGGSVTLFCPSDIYGWGGAGWYCLDGISLYTCQYAGQPNPPLYETCPGGCVRNAQGMADTCIGGGIYPPNAFPPPNGAIYPPNYNGGSVTLFCPSDIYGWGGAGYYCLDG